MWTGLFHIRPPLPPPTVTDHLALRSGVTRDHRRDLEAVGITVARYCNLCRRAIPIEDERTEDELWRLHVERHRRRDGRTPQ